MQAVLAQIVAIIAILLGSGAFAAPPAPSVLSKAIAAARAEDWRNAQKLAQLQSGLGSELVMWFRLRAGEGTADEALSFLDRNPDWPGLPYLRAQSEAALLSASDDQVLAFFQNALPQRSEGALALCRSLNNQNRQKTAQTVALLAWRSMPMDAREQKAFLQACGDGLDNEHIPRIDAALWQGWAQTARAMVPLVPDDWKALARARLALAQGDRGVDALIAAVPPSLAANAGLAFERMRWRLRNGNIDGAEEILLSQSTSASRLGMADRWSTARARILRERMNEGKWQKAYKIAASHFLPNGDDYAEFEWLAGFIALRKLNDAQTALGHFQRLTDAVQSPISLGRAGYWRGRAHEALGQKEQAQLAFAAAAKHQTSFYGQLAADRASLPIDAALKGDMVLPRYETAPFLSSRVFNAANELYAAGEMDLAERFYLQLAENLSENDLPKLGAYIAQHTDPHIQVRFGKFAASRGIELPWVYYPIHDIAEQSLDAPIALVLSIARRESEFNPLVRSSADARGFMQILPATAKRMADKLDIPFDPKRLYEWEYNAQIGSAYLNDLSEQFGGNLPLIAAGYNAGPNRAQAWIESIGDPRDGSVDILDWIELIPYRETRNYVMRVAESVFIYQARLSQRSSANGFKDQLAGRNLLAPPSAQLRPN